MRHAAPRYRALQFGVARVVLREGPGGVRHVSADQALDPYPERITDRLIHWARACPDRVFLGQSPAVRAGDVGIPTPGFELKLVPVGDKTELRYRGPNVTPGYWRAPEATRDAFDAEGFFLTGEGCSELGALIFPGPAIRDLAALPKQATLDEVLASAPRIIEPMSCSREEAAAASQHN